MAILLREFDMPVVARMYRNLQPYPRANRLEGLAV